MSKYKVLDTKGKEINTDISVHPGEILSMELDARKIKKNTFASLIGLRPSHFSELLHGKRNVNAVLALKLHKELSISAEFWLRLQIDYDLFHARKNFKILKK